MPKRRGIKTVGKSARSLANTGFKKARELKTEAQVDYQKEYKKYGGGRKVPPVNPEQQEWQGYIKSLAKHSKVLNSARPKSQSIKERRLIAKSKLATRTAKKSLKNRGR
jgi:cell division FtsZ-interacting protein ZapD